MADPKKDESTESTDSNKNNEWTPELALKEWHRLHELQETTEKEFDDQMAPLIAAHEEQLAPIKSAREGKMSPINDQLETLESWFLQQSEKDGTDEYKSDLGSVSISSREKAKIENSETFYEWVETTKNSELLQKRVSVSKLRSYLEENDGEVPPGITVEIERNAKFKSA